MSILKLAYINVWRRTSYSMLSLVAMFTAAAVLTSAITISQGTVPAAFPEYRGYFGGDIVVYNPGVLGLRQPVDADAQIARRRLMDSGFNPMFRLFPELESGYYALEEWQYRPFPGTSVAELELHQEIARVTPLLTFPGMLGETPVDLRLQPNNPHIETIDQFSYANITIPWDIEITINAYSTTPGRPPTVVTFATVEILKDYFGPTLPQAGTIMEMVIPYFSINAAGIPHVDYSREPKTYRALISSVVRSPTRTVSWLIPPAPIPTNEQGYVHWPDVYLSEGTWQRLWHEHAGGEEYPVLALSLQVHNMGSLYQTVDSLRNEYPHWSILSVRDAIERGNRFNLIDTFYEAPTQYWAATEVPSIAFASQAHKAVAVSLMYLNAGMLLASQMLMAVAGRRNEIGILKTIGARRRDVALLILYEAVIIALIGSLSGYLFVKVAGLHQAMANNVALSVIIRTSAREQGIVLLATLTSAIVFGVLPAWRVSRLAVMDVFRNS